MESSFDAFLTPLPESLSSQEYVIATYLMGADVGANIYRKAVAMALEQTTGTWIDVPGETRELRQQASGRVVAIYSVPDYEAVAAIPPEVRTRFFITRVAFPWRNFTDNIPLLLSSVIGNISAMTNLKLLDLEFPESYCAQFQGPKFGLQGVREILGIRDRPILNNMIKPCTGMSPEVGANLLYEAAVGGVDWVKDDELIAGSPPFSPLEERARAYMDAARRADAEKGEKTLYTINITDEPGRLRENALRAIDAGANALMVNVFATGFSACRVLAEDPRVNVPIMAHTCCVGAVSSAPAAGMSSSIGAKLARLCGADIYLNYVPSVKFGGIHEKFLRIVQTCISPFHHLKPVLVHVGGGVTPGSVPYLMETAGPDIAIGSGGGIHGHPMGPRAGAMAMRQAIDASMRAVPLQEAAKSFPELQAALDTWGLHGDPEFVRQFALAG